MPMMSDYEEDLDDFPAEKKKTDRPNLWLEHIAQNQQLNGQQEVVITTKIPPLFDGSTSWFKYEELIADWLDLTVLGEGKTRTSTEEQTCRRCRNAQGTSQPRIGKFSLLVLLVSTMSEERREKQYLADVTQLEMLLLWIRTRK